MSDVRVVPADRFTLRSRMPKATDQCWEIKDDYGMTVGLIYDQALADTLNRASKYLRKTSGTDE